MRFKRQLVLMVFIFGTELAQAKLFNFSNASVAAYVGGGWAPAFVNTLNSKSSSNAATSVNVNSEHPYNLSGEFGFMTGGAKANIGFGLELMRGKELSDEIGRTSSGSELYSMTSEISVLIPKVRIELVVKSWPKSRLYLGGEAGWATLVARNSYTFTAAGQTEYSGLADFYEELRGMTPVYGGSLGWEKIMSDTTTIILHGGYRGIVFNEVNHNRDVTTFQGAVSKGDLAKDSSGNNRSIDLTSYYVGLFFRFWIH